MLHLYQNMSLTVTQESFDSLTACCDDPAHCLKWNSVFVLPDWLEVWWKEFRPHSELYLGAVRQNDKIIGIAPLQVNNGRASFIGSTDVCDYLDFIIAPGEENTFFGILLDDLKKRGINNLHLQALRPDSTVLTSLTDIAGNRGYEVLCKTEDVSVELELPPAWEEYLQLLTAKQRHEIRRKLRRLEEAGEIEYLVARDITAIRSEMDTFLAMFTGSRSDKATFLTDRMESFFRSMADVMAEHGLLKLGMLNLDSKPIAMIMYFDYNDVIYLYNSGFDREYDSLSVGLLSKVLCLKESIEQGKKKFDFLKGAEIYKYRLGGSEIPLGNCRITIK